MSWFTLSPEQLVAKARGEGSARVLERLADQDEEEGLDDEAAEEHEEADEARATKQTEAARKAVAKSGGSVVYLGGIGAVVFRPAVSGLCR